MRTSTDRIVIELQSTSAIVFARISVDVTLTLYALGGAALLAWLPKVKARLELSKAKHRSLAGHSRIARRIASLLPFYEYDAAGIFRSDDAPDAIVALRQAGFMRLSELYRARFPETLRLTTEVEESLSDLQFTRAYRVPFQYAGFVRQHLDTGAFFQSSSGVSLTDLDGNRWYDLTGSYGVNVFGNDFYKECISQGSERVRELGPVLGAYHPVIAYNVRRLREISGLDEVSFHMSGTEAVMQAVRLARYHTQRSHLVRFCGAYHGWWGDVQPGIGNPVPAHETYTLKDMDDATLRVLRKRRDIACVLVNPLQALHPNRNAPVDSALVDSTRSAYFDREGYTEWLRRLRSVCTERNIVLIFDEVFVGFRLAPGGAQEYFGVRADLVTYGKTLGGGLPIGTARRISASLVGPSTPIPMSWVPCMNSCNASTPQRFARSTAKRSGTAERNDLTGACTRRGCPCRSRTCRPYGQSATRNRPATTGCSSTTCARRA
jgi:glutamate-1-semialdehyde 2,1-aminomutase